MVVAQRDVHRVASGRRERGRTVNSSTTTRTSNTRQRGIRTQPGIVWKQKPIQYPGCLPTSSELETFDCVAAHIAGVCQKPYITTRCRVTRSFFEVTRQGPLTPEPRAERVLLDNQGRMVTSIFMA
jgi:hypothetical protein